MHSLQERIGRKNQKKAHCLLARLPRRAVGVCCKSSVTDLKSGFLPINIEPSKARTLPLLLFFTPRECVGHNPAFIFHYGRILNAICLLQCEGGRMDDGGSQKTLKMRVFHYCAS